MKRLKAHKHILYTLRKCKPCIRKNIIKNAGNELIKCLCEICHNVLNGNVPISKNAKIQLKKYKKSLRNIVSSKVKLHSKRKIFQQRGGFLPTLLSAILSGVVGQLLEKK